MEEKKEITWESLDVSAEQLSQEQVGYREWFAEIRKQLAESNEITREMIGRMLDEEVMELANMCLDELENREYSVLRLCVNLEKVGSPYMLDVVGDAAQIAPSLTFLGVNKELFASILKEVVAGLEQKKKDEFEAIFNKDMGDAEEE